MGKRIDQFSEDLRLKLTNVDSGLSSLKAKIDGRAEHAEQAVRSHLDSVRRRADQSRAKVAAAQAEIVTWAKDREAATGDKIAEWKAKRETAKLQDRADKAERHASATAEVAAAAVDDAEAAALEGWLARQDAKAAQPA
jgi:hypothetical protein